MKNYLLTITTLLITAISFGQTTFTVNNLNYEVLSINPNTVEIIGGTDVPTDLEIPATVENSEGESFSVTAIGTIAFKGDGLTSVSIPSSVTNIDQEAFMNNNLTSVVIPASVTILETRAFNTNQISNLDLGEGVKTIGLSAFGRNSLSSIVIPASVTTIGTFAFFNNSISAVESQAIAPPSIQSNSFGDRSNISLTVPEGTEIAYEEGGWSGFQTVNDAPFIGLTFNIDEITYTVTTLEPNEVILSNGNNSTGNIEIPAAVSFNDFTYSVTAISNNAFGDNSLTSVVIPNTIASIGNTAFSGNAELLSVTSNNTTPPSLGNNVFIDTPTDKSLTIPDGTETTYETAGWTGFATVNGNVTIGTIFTADGFTFAVTGSNPNTVQITDNSNTGVVAIPSSIDSSFGTFNITSIGNNAFRDNSLTSIVIPNTIASIGNTAFRNNAELLSVLSNNTTPPSLGSNVFTDTPNEKTLTVPSGSEAEYETAGWSNNFFTVNGNVTIGKQFSVGNINYEVIANNPNSVSVRGSSQAEINIPNTITISGLELLVTTISNIAFKGNTAINSISLGENIKSIGFEAFRNSSITEITSNALIPPVLEGSVFRNTGIKKLTVPSGTEVAYAEAGWTDFLIINDVFVVGKSFTVDNFNYTVTATTPTVAFTGGDGDDIVIPDTVTIFDIELTVTTIGEDAFRSGSGNRNSVTIGENILNIEDSAFRSSSFIQIISKNTVPPSLGSQVFVASTIGSIIVPVGTIEAYAEAGWPASLLTEATTIELKLKTFLQGAYINPNTAEEDLRNDLQEAALIPLTSTYADERSAARTFDTIQFFSPSILKVTDWIFVEIRDANEPSNVLDSRSLLLQTNGDIVDFTLNNEFTNPTFDQPLVDEYFVVIKHRNHISIRTANTISSNQSFVDLDFTNDPTLVEGGENALVEVSDNIFAMIAGDFDENGQIQPSDVNDTTAAIGTSAYSNADMDMNGQIQPADVNNLVNPNVGRGVQF